MDLDAVSARVEAHLTPQLGPLRLRRIEPLGGGACQDNLRLDGEVLEGPEAGPLALVLRSDGSALVDGTLDRRQELRVIEAACRAGVRTPRARWLGRGLVRDGAWALFLDWAPGCAIGRKVLRDPELAEARLALAPELARELARIHSVLPPSQGGAPIADLPEPPSADPAEAAIRTARLLLSAVAEPHPAMELTLRWLERSAPPPSRLTLVHRDFRTGNFLVTPGGLSAVLDWEFSGWGAPEEDLAWISVRDWRFGRLDHPVGGFSAREPFYLAYEEASGFPVDPAVVLWWEVLGNLRWGLGCLAQLARYVDGARQDLELLAIGRRAAEMEYEALRLIRRGGF